MKVCDGLFVHKEINEGEKDLKDITSVLRLGKTLKIGDHNYENLDEVGSSVSAILKGLYTLLNVIFYYYVRV